MEHNTTSTRYLPGDTIWFTYGNGGRLHQDAKVLEVGAESLVVQFYSHLAHDNRVVRVPVGAVVAHRSATRM